MPPRPLFVTADELLLDDLLRLAAAAGVTPDVATDVTSARRCWITASLVLVGSDIVDQLLRADVVRRANTCVVTRDLDDASIWQRALHLGAETVFVLPDAETGLCERLADAIDGTTPDATTLCVVGGCGGAGASTVAAALALVAVRRQLRVLLVDGDPLGGGIDLVVGTEDTAGLRWPDLLGAHGRVSAASLREALPGIQELAVLSWDRGDLLSVPAETMRAVVTAGQRGSDLVVVDLPRRLDGAAEEALARATGTLLVVPAEVRAIAAASRVAAQLGLLAADIRLVARGPGPSGLDGRLVAETLGLPLGVDMRAEGGVAEALDRGLGPCRRSRGPLISACSKLLDSYGLSGRAAA